MSPSASHHPANGSRIAFPIRPECRYRSDRWGRRCAQAEIWTSPSISTGIPNGSSAIPTALRAWAPASGPRSEEHTSELQSHLNLVCRLLLEKKNKGIFNINTPKNYKIRDEI